MGVYKVSRRFRARPYNQLSRRKFLNFTQIGKKICKIFIVFECSPIIDKICCSLLTYISEYLF